MRFNFEFYDKEQDITKDKLKYSLNKFEIGKSIGSRTLYEIRCTLLWLLVDKSMGSIMDFDFTNWINYFNGLNTNDIKGKFILFKVNEEVDSIYHFN